MKYSILLSAGPSRPEQVVPFANLVKWTVAERLWQGQGMLMESHHVAGWLGGLGIRVPVGFGVSLMPFRSPYQAALEARSVALCTGHPVVAGFGPGGRAVQEALLGKPYADPLQACREYLQIVRGLLDREEVDVAGVHHSVNMALMRGLAPPVEVGLGVLRPKMAALAGEVADVAITWMTPARHIRDTLAPAVHGARRAGGGRVRIVAYVPVALAGPDRDPVALAVATCGSHLRLPHYRAALRTAGVSLPGDEGPADAAALVDGGVFHHGTAAGIHEQLEEYRAAGVDEIVLNATGVGILHGPAAAATDLLRLLETVPA